MDQALPRMATESCGWQPLSWAGAGRHPWPSCSRDSPKQPQGVPEHPTIHPPPPRLPPGALASRHHPRSGVLTREIPTKGLSGFTLSKGLTAERLRAPRKVKTSSSRQKVQNQPKRRAENMAPGCCIAHAKPYGQGAVRHWWPFKPGGGGQVVGSHPSRLPNVSWGFRTVK